MKPIKVGRVDVYLEARDAWVGVFDNDTTVYVCPVPFLVLRYQGDPWGAGVATVLPAFLISGLWVDGVHVPGWLLGAGVYLLALGALATVLATRRRVRQQRADIAEHGCNAEHCLYCCDCPGCAKDRGRAFGIGVGLGRPFGHRDPLR